MPAPARRHDSAFCGARRLWLLSVALLAGCGGDGADADDYVSVNVAHDDVVQLSVFAGCENEFHGTCDVLDSECQDRVFATARCLRRQPDAVLPVVRVISKEELIAEVMSETSEVTETSDEAATAAADEAADAALTGALELLGLAEPEELSEESYAQVFVDTVPAYYSNVEDVVTLVDGASGSAPTKTLTLLHEFVHALQDQGLSLAALQTDEAMSFDRYLAALSIVEGEAEMLESFVAAATWGLSEDPNFRKSYTSWVPSAEESFAGQSPLLVAPRYFPYSYGARFVFDVFASEGSAGVRALFEAPPTSVLPMLLNTVGPVAVQAESLSALPEPQAPIGFAQRGAEALGPWVFGKFVERAVPGVLDSSPASHWRGDRLSTWSGDAEGVAAVWTVRLDTLAAATELFESVRVLTVVGLPSPNAFCLQSGSDVMIGVTGSASARDQWAASVADAASGASAASAPTPGEIGSAAPSTPSAEATRLVPPTPGRLRPGPTSWRGKLTRFARRMR
ncbi:MAG TPA: hypothetical protein VNN80_34045 [Polyangiaceae bacterium]|nr:hypothetical protein [Polyangiaceae bacterium]